MRDTTISRIMDYALATDFAVRAGWRARSGVTSSGTPSGALWAVRTAPGQNEPCHLLRRHGRSTSDSGPAGRRPSSPVWAITGRSPMISSHATYPPSMVRLEPVMKPALLLARYATSPAISSGSPMRARGIRGFTLSARLAVMSVAVGPGWTLLTVIAREARSIATPRTMDAIAPFVMEYTLAPGNAVLTAVLLPMVMILPPSVR